MEIKYRLDSKKILTAIFSASVVVALTSCSAQPEKVTETNEITQTNDTLEQLTQEEKDSAAETAIEIMLDGADKLGQSASEAANSEEVQQELDRSMQNFKDLSDFIFNGSEINGVTFSELSDEGKQKALNALDTLDNTIEYLVPNYKERFKNWFTDSAASGLDALSNLKDEGLELWEEIKSKRNTK